MSLEKIYLIQTITAAANNLRLNPQQIEVVGLLRETITKAEDVGAEFLKMKKSTELSKLAIRLSEINSFLTQGKVDFVKISDQFKEHSRYLIRDLNQFLENVSPQVYKNAFNKINNGDASIIDVELVDRGGFASKVMIEKEENVKKEFNFSEQSEIASTSNFETKILEPIKSLDEILKKMSSGNIDTDELKNYCSIINENALISRQQGFQIITKMHLIIASTFNEIIEGTLSINKNLIDSLRSCLIVIVAIIKKKDVDVNDYLSKAEEFNNKHLKKNIRI